MGLKDIKIEDLQATKFLLKVEPTFPEKVTETEMEVSFEICIDGSIDLLLAIMVDYFSENKQELAVIKSMIDTVSGMINNEEFVKGMYNQFNN